MSGRNTMLILLGAFIFSAIGYFLNWNATHPATGEVIDTVNLLSKEGFHKI